MVKEICIYFHRDFDGMVSAALIADYAQEKWSEARIKFFPVGYGKKECWTETKLKGDISFVLDYIFHPQATFWFDHHQTGLNHYEGPLDPKRHFYNPQKGSCALLIWEILYDVFNYRNLNFSDLVNWAHKIDSVTYQLEEIVSCAHPAFKIHLSLAIESDNAYLIELTRLFCSYKDRLFKMPLPLIVEWRFKKAYQMRKQALEEFKSKVQYDPVTKIVSFQVSQHFFTCRWAPYYLYPDCLYAVGIIELNNGRYMIAVNENPWRKSQLLNIGQLCHRFGGGGHPAVGGITVSNLTEAQEIAITIINQLISAISSSGKD